MLLLLLYLGYVVAPVLGLVLLMQQKLLQIPTRLPIPMRPNHPPPPTIHHRSHLRHHPLLVTLNQLFLLLNHVQIQPMSPILRPYRHILHRRFFAVVLLVVGGEVVGVGAGCHGGGGGGFSAVVEVVTISLQPTTRLRRRHFLDMYIVPGNAHVQWLYRLQPPLILIDAVGRVFGEMARLQRNILRLLFTGQLVALEGVHSHD